jgi:hypothetical protein
VRVWFTGLLSVTLTLLGERGTPLEAPAREREIVPVKLFWRIRASWVEPLDPCWIARLVGLRERLKTGGLELEYAVRKEPRNNRARNNRARIKVFLMTLPPFPPLKP